MNSNFIYLFHLDGIKWGLVGPHFKVRGDWKRVVHFFLRKGISEDVLVRGLASLDNNFHNTAIFLKVDGKYEFVNSEALDLV